MIRRIKITAGSGVMVHVRARMQMQAMSGEGDTYTCASCGESCTKGRSDEEAMAEAESLMAAADLAEGMGIVCDPCWTGIMGRAQIEAPELLNPGTVITTICHRTASGMPVHIRPGCRCPR